MNVPVGRLGVQFEALILVPFLLKQSKLRSKRAVALMNDTDLGHCPDTQTLPQLLSTLCMNLWEVRAALVSQTWHPRRCHQSKMLLSSRKIEF